MKTKISPAVVGAFVLGAFAIGTMLLLHLIRLQHYNDLWIDCAGDGWSPGTNGVFSESPCFSWFDDELASLGKGVCHPAPLRIEKLRLEQPHRVAAREAERFLDNDLVMTLRADF